MKWKADWGLRARMGLTMFLLFALYIVFVAVLWAYTDGSLLLVVLVFGASRSVSSSSAIS
jgi:heat shock protein HtpX